VPPRDELPKGEEKNKVVVKSVDPHAEETVVELDEWLIDFANLFRDQLGIDPDRCAPPLQPLQPLCSLWDCENSDDVRATGRCSNHLQVCRRSWRTGTLPFPCVSVAASIRASTIEHLALS
jgi:hypothetical protein